MNKKIVFYTLGCRLNQAETASLKNQARGAGFAVTTDVAKAQICVINTCTVTAKGDADARRLIHRVARQNENCRVAVIGCQAQTQAAEFQKMKNVFWVIGSGQKMELARILKASPGSRTQQIFRGAIAKGAFKQPFPSVTRSRTRANLKLQDGCDNYCSYCEIPYARGRARSRDFYDAIKEAQALAAAGHREIVLTGINLGIYRHRQHGLLDVIKALEDISGVERIRVSSIEPADCLKEIIRYMTGSQKMCRYLHVPLQHGDSSVLKKMKRRYCCDDYQALVQQAVEGIPGICLGTDIIVGSRERQKRPLIIV